MAKKPITESVQPYKPPQSPRAEVSIHSVQPLSPQPASAGVGASVPAEKLPSQPPPLKE